MSDKSLCAENVCRRHIHITHDVGRHFVSWQGLANKGSWDPPWSIGRADAHQTWDCRTTDQPPEETLDHPLKRLARRTTHAIHKFLCNCKIVWRMAVLPVGGQFAGGGLKTSIKHRLFQETMRWVKPISVKNMLVSHVFLLISAVFRSGDNC